MHHFAWSTKPKIDQKYLEKEINWKFFRKTTWYELETSFLPVHIGELKQTDIP